MCVLECIHGEGSGIFSLLALRSESSYIFNFFFWLSQISLRLYHVETPALVRSPMLSNVVLGEYVEGWSLGNIRRLKFC